MTYEKPEFELIELDAKDIVTTSTSCLGDSSVYDGPSFVIC